MILKTIADYCRLNGLYCCCLAMLALFVSMQLFALPDRSAVTLETAKGKNTLATIPNLYTGSTPASKTYKYQFNLYYTDLESEQTHFSITPAGCVRTIKVNNQLVPFVNHAGCVTTATFYWNPPDPPVYLDLQPYLQKGLNAVTVETSRAEFNIGPVILQDAGKLCYWLGLGMALVCCMAIMLFMESLTHERITGAIITVGFLVYLNRLSHMGAGQFSMDLPGHLDYIAFIAERWKLPNPYWGWSYYHAPLYYMVCAVLVHIANLFRSVDPYTWLQLFSLGCFLTFIIFSVLTLRKLLAPGLSYYMAITLLVFYPSGILFAYRIDSHLLFYSFYAACIYYTVGWIQNNQTRNLGLLLACLGLAMATRTNALVLFPILLIAGGYQMRQRGWQSGILKNKWVMGGAVVMCLGLAASFGRTEYYHITQHQSTNFTVGNSQMLTPRLRIEPASFSKLFIPDLSGYLTHPLWSVWVDSPGRQYFWNSMLKSSLFGEYGSHRLWTAQALSDLLLGLIIFCVDGYMLHRNDLRRQNQWWMCLITLLIPIVALMRMRVIFPYACSEDFRYIYPALVSFCALYGLVLAQHFNDWRPFRAWLGVGMCAVFSVLSVSFYLL